MKRSNYKNCPSILNKLLLNWICFFGPTRTRQISYPECLIKARCSYLRPEKARAKQKNCHTDRIRNKKIHRDGRGSR